MTAPLSRRCSTTSSSARSTKKCRRSVAMQASRKKQNYIVNAPRRLAHISTMIKTKYWKDKEFQIRYKSLMRAKYSIDAKYRASWRQKMRQKMKPIMRQIMPEKMWAKYVGDPKYHMAHQQKMQQKMRARYPGDVNFRATHQQKMLTMKRVKRADRQLQQRTDPVVAFTQHIQEGPIYTCVSCHRHLYRQTVVKLNLSRCKPESRQLLSAMLATFNSKKHDQLYICRTCQTYVRHNQVPSQAAINGLKLDDTPKQLHLTELESALIAQRVPFMKVLALPRDRQRAIRGAVVNVPSNISSTKTVLPLTPAQAGIIPIKLKRRLRYKGYVMHQFVRPDAILSAVRWLVQNNQLYCGLDVDEDWHKSCMEEDPEAWNSMTGGVTQPAEHHSDVEPSSESNDTEPVAQDSDVEPLDSGNDSDRDVVMEKVRGLSFSTCAADRSAVYSDGTLCGSG